MKIHQLKIDFNVTERVRRFVYVYIIEAENCYLIDSGVFGCQKQIVDYLAKIGRKPEDVKGLFLTHAHPDHIGSAAWWQEHTDCKIYASEGEKLWIEDIDLQFKERPIPRERRRYHRLGAGFENQGDPHSGSFFGLLLLSCRKRFVHRRFRSREGRYPDFH